MSSIFPTTPRPCPAWCTLPAGHGWESIFESPGGDLAQRYHLSPVAVIPAPVGPVRIDIMASEQAPTGGGLDLTNPDRTARAGVEDDLTVPSWTTPPTVAIQWPEAPADLSAGDARALATILSECLRDAADQLDQIAGRS